MSMPTDSDQKLTAALARIAELEATVKKAVSSAQGAHEPPKAPPIDERIWTVITAVVAAVVPEPHRITSIQMQGLPPLNLWAFEGRRAIFYSHQLRRS